MKNKKRSFLVVTVVMVLVIVLSCIVSVYASTSDEPTLQMASASLSLEESVYLRYRVNATNISAGDYGNIQLLVWTKAPADHSYVYGTQNRVLSPLSVTMNNGQAELVYKLDGIMPYQMTDDVYVRAYYLNGGKAYYSTPVKYSILEYCYNKLGKTAATTASDDLKALLNNMLAYGASLQTYVNYKTNALATNNFYKITVSDGVMVSDGFNKGFFQVGDTIVLQANTAPENKEFVDWKNSLGQTVGTDERITLTVSAAKNETYTATYVSIIRYSDGLTFSEIKGSDGSTTVAYAVSGIGSCADTHVLIPPTYNGLPVTAIKEGAFKGCTTVTGITIPESVTLVEPSAFSGCTNLSVLLVEPQNPVYKGIGNCLIEKATKTLVAGCKSSVIPVDGTVTRIGERAFEDCTGLTAITIPNVITSIGDYAFAGCVGLRSLSVPYSVVSIGRGIVAGCINIDSLTVATLNTVYHSDKNCIIETATKTLIAGCRASVIPVDGTVTSIAHSAFMNCTTLMSIDIPYHVTKIDDFAFYGCSGLTALNLPVNMQSIGEYAFAGCTGITTLVIPNSVTTLERGAFAGCVGLTSVQLSEKLTELAPELFYGCTGITTLDFPENLATIGEMAFQGCAKLTTLYMPKTVTLVKRAAFKACNSLETVYYSGTEAEWNAITILPENDPLLNANIIFNHIEYSDGLLYKEIYENGTLVAYAVAGIGSCQDSVISVPPTHKGLPVTEIAQSAFENNVTIVALILPDSITAVNDFAFRYCKGLISISLPDSLRRIGAFAFYGCFSLTEISIPDNIAAWGERVFSHCDSLKQVIIGEGSTYLGRYTFQGCTQLVTVIIPSTMEEIDSGAFDKCTSIEKVYYSGSERDWKYVYISLNNECLTDAEIVFNYIP